MDEKIKAFVVKFFTSLKSTVIDEGDKINVKNISGEFEKFYGKKGPYKYSFNGSEAGGYEAINKGSFLLKCINDFLEGFGQTTILKINFDSDIKKEIIERFKLINCEVNRIDKRMKNDYIIRFTFSTTFQYLNEKEQFMSTVHVKEGKIIDINLDNYKTTEGKKKEGNVETLNEDYKLAKEKVKEILKPKLESVSKELTVRLNTEIERIKEHYKNQIGEIVKEIENNKRRLSNLEKEKDEALIKGKEFDEEVYLKRKDKIMKDLEKLEKSEEKRNAEKEEEMLIKGEVQKHSLNMKTKLMNTTIIYYEQIGADVIIKNNKSARIVQFGYDPMKNEMTNVKCDGCGLDIKEIILCDSGHLTCKLCGTHCENCKGIYLDSNLKKSCYSSKKKICDKCAIRCYKCGNFFTSKYIKKDSSGRDVCFGCLEICEICGNRVEPEGIILRQGRKICNLCVQRDVKEKTLKDIFR
jgi:hypothetical protein